MARPKSNSRANSPSPAESSRSTIKSPSKKATKVTDAKESDESDTTIPLVGGFFLPKRQLYRASAILFVLISALIGGAGYQGFDLLSLTDPQQWIELIVSIFFLSGSTKWSIHIFGFSCWFGCSMWVSFVAGLVMFYSLPRHTFGRLQAKLFPRYFQYSTIFLAICLVMDFSSRVALSFSDESSISLYDSLFGSESNNLLLPQTQLLILFGILLIVLLNMLVFEPKTTAIMFERHKVEVKLGTGHEIGQLKPSDPEKANDPELRRLTKKFGALHGCSTTLNLIALCMGVWHCVWIGGRMK